MFESKTLSREELEMRYEQFSLFIGAAKEALPLELFNLLASKAYAMWVIIKAKEETQGDTENNLPPGWVVYNGKQGVR